MKKILIGIVILVLAGIAVFVLLYNKPHRNPAKEEAIKTTAAELFHLYESNETEANKLYLDKVLEVTGSISEITSNQQNQTVVVLSSDNTFFGVRCTMSETELKPEVGQTITIRGICTGYLSDVIITNATIEKK